MYLIILKINLILKIYIEILLNTNIHFDRIRFLKLSHEINV